MYPRFLRLVALFLTVLIWTSPVAAQFDMQQVQVLQAGCAGGNADACMELQQIVLGTMAKDKSFSQDERNQLQAAGSCMACVADSEYADYKKSCDSGGLSDCYRAAAAQCACWLRVDPATACHHDLTEVRNCVAENQRTADSMKSDQRRTFAPSQGATAPASAPDYGTNGPIEPLGRPRGSDVHSGRGSTAGSAR